MRKRLFAEFVDGRVCLAKARSKCACELLKLLGTEQKSLVFGERISQAEELYQILRQRFPGRVGRIIRRAESKTVREKNYWICMKKLRDAEIVSGPKGIPGKKGKFPFTKQTVCDSIMYSGFY